MTIPTPNDLRGLLDEAAGLLARAGLQAPAELTTLRDRLARGAWSVLVSGLQSVGKSSLVSALWSDAELLPTAVRDCTQTNTLVRVPAAGEVDRRLRVRHLPRDQALAYALRDLSFYRLAAFVEEILGPTGPNLDEGPIDERLRAVMDAVRGIFDERADLYVLHEHLTDELEKLEQFLAFLDSSAYRPGEELDEDWADRRRELMGHRRPDGRTVDVGHLLAYQHVELVRACAAWTGAAGAPLLIDTPWIPTFHNARRADLILDRAREADLLVVAALPEKYEPEPWLREALKERPSLAKRTLFVFNQADTIDPAVMWGRGGFAETFRATVDAHAKEGFLEEHHFITCARLPFLELADCDEFLEARAAKLREVLGKLRETCESRAKRSDDGGTRDLFTRRLREATDLGPAARAGLGALRGGLEGLAGELLRKDRPREVRKALALVEVEALPEAIRTRCSELVATADEWGEKGLFD